MSDADGLVALAQQALWVTALACAPILIPALIVGFITGMMQAATSINEASLSFVPKLVIVGISLALCGAMILGWISDFTLDLFARIPDIVR